jgi:hypothetical protein
MDYQNISDADMFYVEAAKNLNLVWFEMDGAISEQEKGSFFRYLISWTMFEQQTEQWSSDGGYSIPLVDIEEILFTYLPVDSIEPTLAFGNQYDEQAKALILPMIGGYGGVRALGLLDIIHDGDNVIVVLGMYDMEDFYGDNPQYILLELYTVIFKTYPSNSEIFQIQFAKRERIEQ